MRLIICEIKCSIQNQNSRTNLIDFNVLINREKIIKMSKGTQTAEWSHSLGKQHFQEVRLKRMDSSRKRLEILRISSNQEKFYMSFFP
jgi:hypothetical protein